MLGYTQVCSLLLVDSFIKLSFFSIFTLHGEGLDCGDEAGIWFDEFLGKPGHRLFNGHGKNLKHRELKESPVWGDLAQDGDQVEQPRCFLIFKESENIVRVLKSTDLNST